MEKNMYNIPTEKLIFGRSQITRDEAKAYFGKEQFAECMAHANEHGLLVAFVGVKDENGSVVNAYVSKVPDDGKQRPLEYERP